MLYFWTFKLVNMKNNIILICAAVIVVLSVGLSMAMESKKEMEEKWKVAAANVKAYDKLLSDTRDKNVAYQLTTSQLSYVKDSVLKELDATRKRLRIKDKNLKSLQYVKSVFIKTDTLEIRDTIFRESSLDIDTLIGDKWYHANVSLKYPSTVIIKPEFKSEKKIIVHLKKETVNPPKKCWLLRLFQKKHKVVTVDIIESNPYVCNEQSRYIEILK